MLGGLYPKPEDLIANELATLKFLKDNATVQEQYPVLATDANRVYFSLKGKVVGFCFESYIEVVHDGAPRRLYLGCLIELTKKAYGHITYYLAVGNAASDGLLRKFHFDVAQEGQAARQAHPLFHLQYCGKLSRYLRGQGFSQSHLDPLYPQLSEPRIFCAPMSSALLLDLVLHEFPGTHAVKLRNTPEWQALVRRNEKLMLHPYYTKCCAIISKDKLLAEAFDVH